MIQARGARLLFLPPYSPDLKPIEKVFSKLKALLRKAAEGLWTTIGKLLDAFPPAECANDFAAAGYNATRAKTALVSLRLSLRHADEQIEFSKLSYF